MQRTMTNDQSYAMIQDVLSHHGVMGMKWGERNGPPYPLSYEAHSESERKAGWQQSLKSKLHLRGQSFDSKMAKIAEKKRKAHEKQLAKARAVAAKKRKEEQKEAERQEREEKKAVKINKMKTKLLKKGDLDKINRKAKYFTNEELRFAQERALLMEQSKQLKKAKKQPQQNQKNQNQNQQKPYDANTTLRWLANNLGEISKISTSVMNVASNAVKIKNARKQWNDLDESVRVAPTQKPNIAEPPKPKKGSNESGGLFSTKKEKPSSDSTYSNSMAAVKSTKVSDIPESAKELRNYVLSSKTWRSPSTTTESTASKASRNYVLSDKIWRSAISSISDSDVKTGRNYVLTKGWQSPTPASSGLSSLVPLSTMNKAVSSMPSITLSSRSSLLPTSILNQPVSSMPSISTKSGSILSNLNLSSIGMQSVLTLPSLEDYKKK